jgi:hypothetical protein
MEKMELGKNVQILEGLTQNSFALRDIHFEGDSLVVHTLQGNIVPLPSSSFFGFISAIQLAVKEALVNPSKIENGGNK